jgi:hypothetical protein
MKRRTYFAELAPWAEAIAALRSNAGTPAPTRAERTHDASAENLANADAKRARRAAKRRLTQGETA